MIELFDVGRTIVKPFKQGYEFIREHGEEYISDHEALERIMAYHRDKSVGISQEDFELLSFAWVQGLKNGTIPYDAEEMVYEDAKEFLEQRAKRMYPEDKAVAFTSGSTELTEMLLGDVIKFDAIITGEIVGDKRYPETYERLVKMLRCNSNIFTGTDAHARVGRVYDDNPEILKAAADGFAYAKTFPYLYLIDREGRVSRWLAAELRRKGIMTVDNFHDLTMQLYN